MNRNLGIILLLTLFLTSHSKGQDTIRLNKKPEVIIKSWYPEFKEFPDLKIGQSTILFTYIPDFKTISIRDYDINLLTQNESIQIKETEKPNQYLITVEATGAKSAEFELWLELCDQIILIKHAGKWEDIRTLYPVKGNRILLDTIKLILQE